MARPPGSLHPAPLLLSPRGKRFASATAAIEHLVNPQPEDNRKFILPDHLRKIVKKRLSKKQSRLDLRKKAILYNAERAREEAEVAEREKKLIKKYLGLLSPLDMEIQVVEPGAKHLCTDLYNYIPTTVF